MDCVESVLLTNGIHFHFSMFCARDVGLRSECCLKGLSGSSLMLHRQIGLNRQMGVGGSGTIHILP